MIRSTKEFRNIFAKLWASEYDLYDYLFSSTNTMTKRMNPKHGVGIVYAWNDNILEDSMELVSQLSKQLNDGEYIYYGWDCETECWIFSIGMSIKSAKARLDGIINKTLIDAIKKIKEEQKEEDENSIVAITNTIKEFQERIHELEQQKERLMTGKHKVVKKISKKKAVKRKVARRKT